MHIVHATQTNIIKQLGHLYVKGVLIKTKLGHTVDEKRCQIKTIDQNIYIKNASTTIADKKKGENCQAL